MKVLLAFLLAASFLVCGSVLPSERAFCQDTTLIREIRVSGLEQVDSTVVLESFGLSAGDVFSFETVRQGVSNLYSLGYFADVSTEAEETEDGIILRLILTENPRITGIRFEGLKGVDEGTLKEKLTVKENDFFTERVIFAQKKIIVDVYREEGFPLAEVTSVRTREREEGKVEVTFEINEGHKVKIRTI